MFDVGFWEILLIIFVSIFMFDIKDLPKLIKAFSAFWQQINKFRLNAISLINDIEKDIRKDEIIEQVKVDFNSFSKEFLEPVNRQKNKDNA